MKSLFTAIGVAVLSVFLTGGLLSPTSVSAQSAIGGAGAASGSTAGGDAAKSSGGTAPAPAGRGLGGGGGGPSDSSHLDGGKLWNETQRPPVDVGNLAPNAPGAQQTDSGAGEPQPNAGKGNVAPSGDLKSDSKGVGNGTNQGVSGPGKLGGDGVK